MVPLIRRKGAPDVQAPFVLQHFYAAPADRGVHMLIDARPWNGRDLRQIDNPGSPLISQQRLNAALHYQSEWQTMPNLDIDDAILQPS